MRSFLGGTNTSSSRYYEAGDCGAHCSTPVEPVKKHGARVRTRDIVIVVAIAIVVAVALPWLGRARGTRLGPELYSGTGKVYYSTATSDGIRDYTLVTFTKNGLGKTFTFCGDNADLFADRAFKFSMSFRWNPKAHCDQLTGVTREMGKHWDTVWFWSFDDGYTTRAPVPM